MNYPNLNYGVTFRFTLYKVVNPDGEKKEQNLKQKYTKQGLEDFQQKVEDDHEVDLNEDLDRYEVQVETIESRVDSLRSVIGHETVESAF